jgi:hypothetical protein
VWTILGVYGQQRRLCQESRTMTVVLLRGMHQERVTQVHRAGFSGCGHDGSMGARGESISCEFPQCQSLFPRGRKLPRDVRM